MSETLQDGWLIHKVGRGWYRELAQGYCAEPHEAGRFSHADAVRHSQPNGPTGPTDGITIQHESSLFKAHNHYDPQDLAIIRSHYNPLDARTWPYYPIVMPLKDGQGPADAAECDKITWEVWDRFCNSVYSSEYLPHAINEALRLNKEVFP